MCGVIGIASSKPVQDRAWLARGRDAMAHRGPDAAGEVWSDDGRVGLGHRRLAIVDLSPLGQQPMASADGRLVICYNGEIYNFHALRTELESLGHQFRSRSDTEVILAAYRQWGADCLVRLEGMFALALHDLEARTVLLARDRAGEKPLFYRHAGGEVRFASELKGLLADPALPRRINREALDCYLTWGYAPGGMCILDGFAKLPPAHAALFDLDRGDMRVWRWWSMPDFQTADTPMSDSQLLDTLEATLEASVARQLVADVPVGLLLSGGVDSSLITALAVRAGGRLKTFTVGFSQFDDFDETAHAALIANHFQTDHTVLAADHVGPELLPRLAAQFDEPMIDSSMIPTFLVSEQISQHCKVALGGDGGDELFGGYHSASRIAALHQRLAGVPLAPRRALAAAAAAFMPPGMKGRPFLTALGTDMTGDVPPFAMQFDRVTRAKLMAAQPDWPFVGEAVRRARVPDAADPVQRMTRLDFANYMPEDILVKVDRASMLNSLELRAPFLDTPVIEFAYGRVPARLKANAGERKIILKQLAARLLPPEFDKTRKQGFGIPINRWLTKPGPWRTMVDDVLLDPGCTFDRNTSQSLMRGLEAGRPVKENIFGLALFELWRRHYQVSL